MREVGWGMSCLEWDLSHWLSLGEFLLLLELLVAGLDGDGKTDLGLLLWGGS